MDFNEIVDTLPLLEVDFEKEECTTKLRKAISLYKTPTTAKKDYKIIKDMRGWPIWTKHCFMQ